MAMQASASQAMGVRTPDHPCISSWCMDSKAAGFPEATAEIDDQQAVTPPVYKSLYSSLAMAMMMEQLSRKLGDVQKEQDTDEEDRQLDEEEDEEDDCALALVRQYAPLNLGGLGLAGASPTSQDYMELTRQYTPINLGLRA